MRTETLSFLIYVLSVGVLGLLGWQLYEKHDMRWVGIPGVGKPPAETVSAYRKRVAQSGTGSSISERRWSYSNRMIAWWDVIKEANLTGKLPPPPEELVSNADQGKKPEVETPQTPLKDVIRIVTTLGWTKGTTKLVYKEGSGVERPPSRALGLLASPSPGAQPGMAPGQTQPVLGPVYQDISMGESLYPPFQMVKAVRVVSDGSEVGVVFSRPAPKKRNAEDPAAKSGDAASEDRIEETVWVNQLDIQGQHFSGLNSIGGAGGTGTGTPKSGGTVVRKGTWEDPGEKTQKIGDVWQISMKDQKYLSSPAKLLEDVAVQDFSEEWVDPDHPGGGSKVRVKGVAIRKISPALKRFGVVEGEILIKINGLPVSGRANAMNVGKKEYNRGVRTFELTFLNNYGREVTRSYQAPN